MNAAIIIPALNPGEELLTYIRDLIGRGVRKLILVDDGSKPECRAVFEEIRSIPECEVLVHEVNLGKGKALKDAFAYYLEQGYDKTFNGVITADADGQHTAQDVEKVSRAMDEVMKEGGRALVLGEREFGKDVPFRSKFGNSITAVLFRAFYHIRLRDTQTGLRGLPNDVINEFTDLDGDRYEYEMNMLMRCSERKIAIRSVTIETIYLEGNKSSHFNPIIDSFKIYRLLLGTFFRYILSSLSSFVIDMAAFQLFIMLLKPRLAGYIFASTVVARVISAVYNYTVNRKLVFRSKSGIMSSGVKYLVLCVVQMLMSALLVSFFYGMLRIPEVMVKALVDTVLFLISFQIQKRLVF